MAILVVGITGVADDELRTVLPAHPSRLVDVRRRLVAWLAAHGATRRETSDIVLATHEACMNAIEHAFAPSLRDAAVEGRVQVHAQIDGAEVDVLVTDHGHWRERRVTSGGRGIRLMRSLMDEVDVTPSTDGTTVRLHRAVALRQPPV